MALQFSVIDLMTDEREDVCIIAKSQLTQDQKSVILSDIPGSRFNRAVWDHALLPKNNRCLFGSCVIQFSDKLASSNPFSFI